MSPTFLALSAGLLLGTLHVVLPRIVLQVRRRRLQAVCRRLRAIVLTFDDGPSRVLTPQVVDRLVKAGVPATFFVLGERLQGNEQTVHAMLSKGYELGSHGSTHVHHIWSWPWEGILDTRDGWRALYGITKQMPHDIPFRPPYGKLNLLSLFWVLWHRAPIAMWTHDGGDSWDGHQLPPAELASAVRRDGGGVVLMHDFDRLHPDAGAQVLAKIDAVLQLKEEGFSFLCLSDLLAAEAPVAAPLPRESASGRPSGR